MDEKGLTLWCGSARRNWQRILFPAVCSCFGAGAGRRFGYSTMTARDTGWRKNVFREENSYGGRKDLEPAKPLEAYEAQLLMAAGDVSRVRAAPMWRRVNVLK